ncbi:hypothetical protein GCM10010172_63700 [Paractinoplanes ferrugineus]|uniref:Ricin B lectin domain-containing protein n=1 Tax=Paractinoplanes ferrugineus TaxID=113564 RepID=A0A919JB71_9ACTN|nr:hypothetical protein [Actinoplanes ferrugineus]GIE16438.1 hypothetical protein Afe05nite_82780 [Actinoplanes ferrugineus]
MRTILVGAFALAALTACAGNTPVATGAPTSSPAGPSAAAGAGSAPTTAPSSRPAASPGKTSKAPSAAPAGTKTTKADVSQLRSLGIDLDAGVLLDVADDGVDRYLAIGKDGVVDFTGTGKTDATMMSLKAAPGGARNQVLIQPPFWNEDLGTGSCVTDTAGAALKLETCAAGKPAQVWTVVPAGDSGQFELRGKYGIVRVDNGKITTGTSGRSGLQTILFAK